MLNLATALDDLTQAFSKYCILPPHAGETCALWCAFTWAHDTAHASPILLITSPTKRCGKTTLLRAIEHFTRNPIAASSATPAVIFRLIERESPTLLMDEADTYIHRNEDWRSIINGGHTRDTAIVLRCDATTFAPKKFSTWSPKVVSMIGKPPETILDRSIVIRVERKLKTQVVKKLRREDRSHLHELRAALETTITPHLAGLRDAAPLLPAVLNDRAGDSWEPLLAIADIAGGHWPSTARRAAVSISGDAFDDETESIELLSNIRESLSARVEDKIFSADLIAALAGREDWRWRRYSDEHPLSEKQLAVRLGPFSIHPKMLRIGSETLRGYTLASFEDAFSRYLPPLTPESATSQQARSSTDCRYKTNGASASSPSREIRLQVPAFLDLK